MPIPNGDLATSNVAFGGPDDQHLPTGRRTLTRDSYTIPRLVIGEERFSDAELPVWIGDGP